MTEYGFIGLGHQGTPMAERMIAAGLKPWLWARRPEVLGRYQHTDAHRAASPAEVGAKCDVIGLCLYDAQATDAVLFGAAQTTKLLNNALMTAITGMVFDVFDIGRRFGIDEAGLGAVLAGGSAANPSIGHYLALGGAQEMSVRAWPTLHKDVALLHDLLAAFRRADGPLVSVAEDTIELMERHRQAVEQTDRLGHPQSFALVEELPPRSG